MHDRLKQQQKEDFSNVGIFLFFTLTLTALIYPLVKSSKGFSHMEAFAGAHSASAETSPGICSLASQTSHRDGITFIFLACLNAAPADPEGSGLLTFCRGRS